jgi:hypothetical protein
MPKINGNYYMNPEVEEKSGKPSVAKELHKSKKNIKKLWAEASEGSLLEMIPKIDLANTKK